MVTIIRVSKKVRLDKPVLVVGLPGVGNVGRMVVKNMIKECKAERFATLNSDHLPHKVIMKKDGTLRVVNNRFYYIKSKKRGANDIVLLTGDDQPMTPEGQYEVNKKIVDFFMNELHGTFVYTIGGYNNVAANTTENGIKVFGNATNKNVLAAFKSDDVVFGESKGFILGSAGMIVAFAKEANLPGICLMGESRSIDIDPPAAKRVTELISKRLGVSVKTGEFDRMSDKLEKMVNRLTSEMQGVSGDQQPIQLHQEDPFSYIR
jgi:hypothetical protein